MATQAVRLVCVVVHQKDVMVTWALQKVGTYTIVDSDAMNKTGDVRNFGFGQAAEARPHLETYLSVSNHIILAG